MCPNTLPLCSPFPNQPEPDYVSPMVVIKLLRMGRGNCLLSRFWRSLALSNLLQTIDVVTLFSLKPRTPEIVCFEPDQTSGGLNPIIWSQTIDRALPPSNPTKTAGSNPVDPTNHALIRPGLYLLRVPAEECTLAVCDVWWHQLISYFQVA